MAEAWKRDIGRGRGVQKIVWLRNRFKFQLTNTSVSFLLFLYMHNTIANKRSILFTQVSAYFKIVVRFKLVPPEWGTIILTDRSVQLVKITKQNNEEVL